jgi:hypothetical protein
MRRRAYYCVDNIYSSNINIDYNLMPCCDLPLHTTQTVSPADILHTKIRTSTYNKGLQSKAFWPYITF